ncbi:uncharacterized protein LOC129598093 [Paramacrobiotus metropolitanus]|uniref:uncharacterized protein LOC129598093 n=1 Tax=Paramacrobiotus metropolitanus TaxID=2943436 RepID=UPI002445DD03|nr:uncharacterized protein LOC129598093 [Paramacrobiotus metropolitanus]
MTARSNSPSLFMPVFVTLLLGVISLVAGQSPNMTTLPTCPVQADLSVLCPLLPNPIPPCPDMCPPYGSDCPSYPTAHCVTKWCSDCTERWYILGANSARVGWFQVTDQCNTTSAPTYTALTPHPGCPAVTGCPPNKAYFLCSQEPCACQTCARIPSAVCCNNFCNQCGFAFYDNGVDVTSSC